MRVLVFGASITQGFWDTEGGWVARLRRHYDELELKEMQDKQPTIFNLGISGDTSSDLLKRFDAEASARLRTGTKSGAIIFFIGTNNAYIEGSNEWLGVDPYRRDLESLLKKARVFTDKIMLVELPPCEEQKTTPVSWRDIYYTNERISKVNEVIAHLGENNSLSVVKTFDKIVREMKNGKELYVDGLHPNNEGHQIICELVRPELDKLLNSK